MLRSGALNPFGDMKVSQSLLINFSDFIVLARPF